MLAPQAMTKCATSTWCTMWMETRSSTERTAFRMGRLSTTGAVTHFLLMYLLPKLTKMRALSSNRLAPWHEPAGFLCDQSSWLHFPPMICRLSEHHFLPPTLAPAPLTLAAVRNGSFEGSQLWEQICTVVPPLALAAYQLNVWRTFNARDGRSVHLCYKSAFFFSSFLKFF